MKLNEDGLENYNQSSVIDWYNNSKHTTVYRIIFEDGSFLGNYAYEDEERQLVIIPSKVDGARPKFFHSLSNAKKVTWTCIKGSKVLKFSGVTKVCPKGYKVKK